MPTSNKRTVQAALRTVEKLICRESGEPRDLLRCADKDATTTLGIFLKGMLVERVMKGSCGWGQLLEGDLIRTVNGQEVDAFTVLEAIRKTRDAVGTAVTVTVERNGVSHEVVLLKQRLDHVTRAEAMVGVLMVHGNLIQQLSEQEQSMSLQHLSRKLQSSFETIQMQFGEMQHIAWQGEHNLSTHIASLQDQIMWRLKQVRGHLHSQAAQTVEAMDNAPDTQAPMNRVEKMEQVKEIFNETLQDKLVLLKKSIAASNAEVVEYAEKLALCENELASKQAWVSSLENQLKEKNIELESCQAICQESDLVVKELEYLQLKAVEDLGKKQHDEVEKIRQRLVGLESEFLESKQRNYELEQSRDAIMLKYKELQQANTSMSEMNAQRVAELADHQKRFLESVEHNALKFNTLEEEAFELDGQLKNMQQKLSETEECLSDAEHKCRRVEEAMENVEHELKHVHARLISVEDERSALEQKERDLLERLDRCKLTEGRMNEQVKCLVRELSVVKDACKEVEQECQGASAELEEMQQYILALEQGRDETILTMEKSEADVRAIAFRCEQAEEEIQQCHNALAISEQRASELEAQVLGCKQRILEEGDEMDAVMMEVSDLQIAVKTQTKKYMMVNDQLTRAEEHILELEAKYSTTNLIDQGGVHGAHSKVKDEEDELPVDDMSRALVWLLSL